MEELAADQENPIDFHEMLTDRETLGWNQSTRRSDFWDKQKLQHPNSRYDIVNSLAQKAGFDGIHNKQTGMLVAFKGKQVKSIPFGKSQLEKGARGDWKSEGYRVSFEQESSKNPYAGLGRFIAHDSQGNQVGYLALYPHRSKANEMVGAVKIEEQHRRKGLASHMYSVAEKTLGKKINPDINNSPDAKALWNQPKRPFGKSELEKGLNGDWKKEGYKLKINHHADYYGKPVMHIEAVHPKHGVVGE